jgi:hypothetical protein
MRAMTRLRRTAFIALLGMAWAVLLPFTSAAHMLLSDEPVPYCHQLSVTLDDEGAPAKPGKPPKGPCPFCSSSVTAAPAQPLPVPCFEPVALGIEAPAYFAPTPSDIEVELPLARAPPAHA